MLCSTSICLIIARRGSFTTGWRLSPVWSLYTSPCGLTLTSSTAGMKDQKVQKIVMPYARSTEWFSHSETVFQTILCSCLRQERVFEVEKILKIRGYTLAPPRPGQGLSPWCSDRKSPPGLRRNCAHLIKD